jgi:hypothetical protein
MNTRTGMMIVLASIVAAWAAPVSSQTTDVQKIAPPGQALPVATQDCHVIDFTSATITRKDGKVLLHVTGQAPYLGTEIMLVPVMYVMMPDYWQMSLVGCRKAADPAQAMMPFSVELNLSGTIGHKGIRLLGASPASQQRLDITP